MGVVLKIFYGVGIFVWIVFTIIIAWNSDR